VELSDGGDTVSTEVLERGMYTERSTGSWESHYFLQDAAGGTSDVPPRLTRMTSRFTWERNYEAGRYHVSRDDRRCMRRENGSLSGA